MEPGTAEAMSQSLAHRGPDAAGVWGDGPVLLGYRALHTTPESLSEHQPITRLGDDAVLTADARIDNRDDLIAALGLSRHEAGGRSDAGLLLAAYERWGERSAERLIGDFAFAVWDARRRVLLCVRDQFGVKPLYYHHAPGRLFAFASEIESLLTLADVSDEIGEFEVARHLRIPLGIDLTTTYYKHIQRLSPAHTLSVSDGGLAQRQYWQLDPERELKLANDDQYAEALREVFVEAVRCRLRSPYPIAAMLSGGMDSASITCVAADLLENMDRKDPLHTLSAVYPRVPESDERAFIDDVLRRHAVIPHFFEADAVNPVGELEQMNRLVGGASWGPNLYLNWELCKIAADAGARVVLDGFDGDSTVSHGFGYLSQLAISGRWLKLALTAMPYSRKQGRDPIADYRSLVRLGLRQRFQGTVVQKLARRIRGREWSGARSDRPAWVADLTVNPDFARRFPDHVSDPPSAVTEREIHWRRLNGQPLREALGWIEACGAGRGVEVRFPFFDIRLVELCLSFPSEQKIRRGWSRYVMRRAMEGILPPSIQWRSGKTSLHHGWVHAYRSNVNGRLDALLADPAPIVRQYLNPDHVRELHARFMSGEADESEEPALWRALSLAVWLTSRRKRRGPG
ncbi:MAG: asparagine synthase-related protein [Gemmatimonadota bacterium]